MQASSFEAVIVPPRRAAYTPLRLVAATAVALALLAAVVFQRSGDIRGSELMQGSDEKMKGWEDGMFPPHASFPAGYHFGSDNVFGKQSSFGAGDTFGDDNVFGKGSTFGAGASFGDRNAFGKKQSFGPGAKFGSYETVGAGSTFQDGTVIGKNNQFGREVEFGRRVSIGRANQFGFDDAFGSNDNLGAKNQFGRGALFGDKIMFGKNQEFGPRNTFASPEYLVGNDQFGHRNWGLKSSDLPANDANAWDAMVAKYPDYIPERVARKRVLTLHQGVEKEKQAKEAQVHVLRSAASGRLISKKSKADAIAAIENAAKTAEHETKRLKKVADALASLKQ